MIEITDEILDELSIDSDQYTEVIKNRANITAKEEFNETFIICCLFWGTIVAMFLILLIFDGR